MTYMYICCSCNPLPTCTCMHLTLTLFVCTIISGTKNASKEIKKVCAGPKRTEVQSVLKERYGSVNWLTKV